LILFNRKLRALASCYSYDYEIEEMCLIRYVVNYDTVFSSNDTALFTLIIGILNMICVSIHSC